MEGLAQRDRMGQCHPTYLHENDSIDGDEEDTVGTGQALDQTLTELWSIVTAVTFAHFFCESFLYF